MSENQTHHIESALAAISDMFHVRARGRKIDREEWYLAKDHARAGEDELAELKREYQELKKRADALNKLFTNVFGGDWAPSPEMCYANLSGEYTRLRQDRDDTRNALDRDRTGLEKLFYAQPTNGRIELKDSAEITGDLSAFAGSVQPQIKFTDSFKASLAEYLRSEEGRAVLDEVIADLISDTRR